MKIAIFHNYLDNIGGAEKVALTLARELKADVYTTNIDKEKIRKMGFSDIELRSIGTVPINAPFRHQSALYQFRKCDLGGKYDFYIIGGDWAMSAGVNNKPNLWYVHSPIREIWDLYHYVRGNVVPWFARWPFDLWVKYNRYLNRAYLRHIDNLACNSLNTQKRIKNYLQRDAQVVYPPIDTSRFYYRKNGDFWLSVNRLFGHKRVEMQIEAFRKLPLEKLIIVGCYEQSRHFKQHARYIKASKPENVEILSWVDSDKLSELYADCKGFIATAKDEDFGMTPVEAMACGKPVIVPNEGGYKETVIDGLTGRLIDNITVDKLTATIAEVGARPQLYKNACLEQASKFTTAVFIVKIKKLLEKGFLG